MSRDPRLSCPLHNTLAEARKAQRGSKITALHLSLTTAVNGCAVNATTRPCYPQYPLHRRLGGCQGRSGQFQENLASTGIRSPKRRGRSKSLYRLRYLGPHMHIRQRIMSNALFSHVSIT